jgi:hypothetical protein
MGFWSCERAHVLLVNADVSCVSTVCCTSRLTAYSSSTQGGIDLVVSSSSSICSVYFFSVQRSDRREKTATDDIGEFPHGRCEV